MINAWIARAQIAGGLMAAVTPAVATTCGAEAEAIARRFEIGMPAPADVATSASAPSTERQPELKAGKEAGSRQGGNREANPAGSGASSPDSGAMPRPGYGSDRPPSKAEAAGTAPTPAPRATLGASDRARLEALLLAAHGAAAQGREDECVEKLREARMVTRE